MCPYSEGTSLGTDDCVQVSPPNVLVNVGGKVTTGAGPDKSPHRKPGSGTMASLEHLSSKGDQ